MNDFWPHKFTKEGKEIKVGEEVVEGTVGEIRELFHQPMICVHCFVKFIQGKEPRPADPCPARTTRKEMKRIMNK